jgi:anti-sigma B factor antagonist
MTKKFSRTDHDDRTTLRIEGVLDAVTVPDIRPTVDAIVNEQRKVIEVDLSSLRLIDSSGVGVIVSLYKRCNAYGGTVRVSGVKDQPLTIFRLLKLDRVFSLP